jgi:hypothetical protein
MPSTPPEGQWTDVGLEMARAGCTRCQPRRIAAIDAPWCEQWLVTGAEQDGDGYLIHVQGLTELVGTPPPRSRPCLTGSSPSTLPTPGSSPTTHRAIAKAAPGWDSVTDGAATGITANVPSTAREEALQDPLPERQSGHWNAFVRAVEHGREVERGRQLQGNEPVAVDA